MFPKHAALALLVIVLLCLPAIAYAHEEITAGDYKIKYGWRSEPPIAGEPNAITLDISNTKDANAKIDVPDLKVEAIYGGETKVLTVSPTFGQQNKFFALLTPTRPGQYTIRLSGKIGTTDVKADVKPEEVDPADTVQFPKLAASTSTDSLGLAGWLGVGGLVAGLLGVMLSVVALTRQK